MSTPNEIHTTMETILDSKTSTIPTSVTDQSIKIKAFSDAALPAPSKSVLVKPQLSAPSYLNYLRENDAPPFKKPDKEPAPAIMTGMIMNGGEAVAMIAAADADKKNGLRRFIGNFLVQKKVIANYALTEKNFLISLVMETINYSAQRDFNEFKLAALITIYLSSHQYFKWYYWQSPTALWKYFMEVMMRHTIEDSPEGEEIFEPDDCYDILTHFHTVYLSNLPLIHIVTFGKTRLKLLWPFKSK